MKRNRQAKWMPRLALAVACLAALAAARAADIAWTNAAGGDFSNPLNWSPNQVPGPIDRAVFDIETPEPYTVTWSVFVTNDDVRVVQGKLTWDLCGNSYQVYRTTTNSGLYSVTFGTADYTLDMLITNGTLKLWTAYPNCHYASVEGDTTVRLAADVSGMFGRYDNPGIEDGSRVIMDGAQMTSGRLYVLPGGELVINNGGSLDAGSMNFRIDAGGTIRVTGAGSYLKSVIANATRKLAGDLSIEKGALVVAWGMAPGTYVGGGRIILDDGVWSHVGVGDLFLEEGMLEGQGVVTAEVVNASGWIKPGGANGAGLLTIKGNLYNDQNENQGTIAVELGGTAAGASDRLEVIGMLYAGGTLAVNLIDGFKPASGDTFDILDFSAVDGAFETLDFPGSTANWDLSQLYTTGEIRYRPVGTVLMVR